MSAEQALEKYIVRFFSGTNLHSAFTVEVGHVKDAVGAAITRAQEVLSEDVSRFTAAITTPDGQGVAGIENLATKAQLQAQLASLQKQIEALNTDGTTPEQNESVANTISNVNRSPVPPPVAAPPASFSAPDPRESEVSAGTPVSASDAPRYNPEVTQADIDAYLAARQQESGPAMG